MDERKSNFLAKTVLALALGAGAITVLSNKDNLVQKREQLEKIVYEPEEKAEPLIENKEDTYRQRLAIFSRYTGGFEGLSTKVYDPNPNDGRSEPTIGIGHYMGRGDSRETFSMILPEVNFDDVLRGRASITTSQAHKLFEYDIQNYVVRAERLVPKLESFPVDVQRVIVDMAYRGDLFDSPKTVDMINKGMILQAANELTNRKDYRKARKNGIGGIRRRLESHQKILRDYAKEKGI